MTCIAAPHDRITAEKGAGVRAGVQKRQAREAAPSILRYRNPGERSTARSLQYASHEGSRIIESGDDRLSAPGTGRLTLGKAAKAGKLVVERRIVDGYGRLAGSEVGKGGLWPRCGSGQSASDCLLHPRSVLPAQH